MATTERTIIGDGFELLAKNTDLSLSEYTLITQGQAAIESFLSRHLPTFSTVLFGAFSRKTMVSPLAGNIIDMLVVFKNDIRHQLPSRVFTELKETLISHYPNASPLEFRQALMLPMGELHFRIQPAFAAGQHNYMMPSKKFNDWVEYDIHAYKNYFEKENVRHRGQLANLIRIIKTWNRVSGSLFNGYYLELLVTDVLSSYRIENYQETLRHIFSAASSEVVFHKEDPANLEFEVDGLNDISDLIGAIKLLKKSWLLADTAVTNEAEGRLQQALDDWRELFPQVFPGDVDLAVGQARKAGVKGTAALKMLTRTRAPLNKL